MPEAVNSVMEETYYRGDANLGGGNFGVVNIDTKPLEQLAAYTFTFNKTQWEQKQKDMEAQAKELADMTAYDLTTAIPKDREIIQKEYDDLYNYAKNNPNVLDYKNNPKGWMEYNKKKNEFENRLRGGKVRSTMYAVRQKEIADATDPDEKIRLQKLLDEEANSTDLNTPLKHSNKWDTSGAIIRAGKTMTFDANIIGDNFNVKRTYSVPDMSDINSTAIQLSMQLQKDNIDLNSEEFKKLPPEEQKLRRDNAEAMKSSGRYEPVDSANYFNQSVAGLKSNQNYLDDKGNIDYNKVAQAGIPIVSGNIANVQEYNRHMDEMIQGIENGRFSDRMGRQLSFSGPNALNRADYKKIDLNDGLQPDEIIKMRMLALTPSQSYKTDIKETDLGLKGARIALDSWAKHAEIGIKSGELALKNRKFNEQMRQVTTQEEQDKALNNYWTENLLGQPDITQATGKGANKIGAKDAIALRLDANKTQPLFMVTGKGAEPLIPFGAKPIYDKYIIDANKNKVGAPNAHVIGYVGGHFNTDYTFSDGRAVPHDQIGKMYDTYKKNDPEWKGSFDDWLKENLIGDNPVFKARVSGVNGTTTKEMNAQGLRIINNRNQKKGQAAIFGDNTDNGGDGSSSSYMESGSSGGSSTDYTTPEQANNDNPRNQ